MVTEELLAELAATECEDVILLVDEIKRQRDVVSYLARKLRGLSDRVHLGLLSGDELDDRLRRLADVFELARG